MTPAISLAVLSALGIGLSFFAIAAKEGALKFRDDEGKFRLRLLSPTEMDEQREAEAS